MRFTSVLPLVALSALDGIAAAPSGSQFPDDGFPNPNPQQIKGIEQAAFGTLSNEPPPPSLSEDTLTSLRLIAFNEIFEVAFFESLVRNITSNKDYFNVKGLNKEFTLDTFKSIVAVEQLHALNANTALVKVGKKEAIKPCKYKFPTTDLKAAIGLAARFTDVVSGTLQDVIVRAAGHGDAALTPGVAGTIGDEAEQDGWFRSVLGERPNAQPFLTRSFRAYAFSILQGFVVPGSCPNVGNIALDIYQPLAAKDPKATDQDLEFTFSLEQVYAVTGRNKNGYDPKKFAAQYGYGDAWRKLSITYLNGQNLPVSVPVKSYRRSGGSVTVTAAFPQEKNLFYGLVLAALTSGKGYASPAEMVRGTLFGPAPLLVQEKTVKPCL